MTNASNFQITPQLIMIVQKNTIGNVPATYKIQLLKKHGINTNLIAQGDSISADQVRDFGVFLLKQLD